MPTLEAIQTTLRRELPYLRAHYHVDTLGVFGSFVRGEQTAGSDLDVLVTFTETPGLLAFVALKQYLEDRLGLRVDLGMPDAVKPLLAPSIFEDVQYL